jgi:predicted nucleic acid-binding protein
MTVLDSSAVVDALMGRHSGAEGEVERLIARGETFHAPDVLVFEVLSALRRAVFHERMTEQRATRALEVFGRLPIELYPSMALRQLAWRLRQNFGAGDALFVALAQVLRAPLATKDRGLASAARTHSRVEVLELGG